MDNPNSQDTTTAPLNGELGKAQAEAHEPTKAPEQAGQTPNGNHVNGTTSENANSNDKSTEKSKDDGESNDSKDKKGPAGGFDATPIPRSAPGWTVKFTIHRAENLPPADMNTFSSDPYVLSQLYCDYKTRHKEDPPLKWRTFTVHKKVNPEWNEEWIVGNVPSSGFQLKCRLYDEDASDHDDRLGNVHVNVGHIDESWKGIKEQAFRIKKRMGSKRAYFIQTLSTPIRKNHRITGHLFVSVELLGRTESHHGGRVYTIGPMRWMKHYSPILGRIVNKKTPDNQAATEKDSEKDSRKPSTERYNFQANQFQLCGPVPADLYHRYVEFRPFVKGMFTGAGLRGFFLHKALSHQHNQIYRFDKRTEFGYLPEKPSNEATLKFLELAHYDEGGRIFTYIITLDALWRFTETGKEFGIDLLSKHTMHSDVSMYIAFSGEFFIRRRQQAPLGNGVLKESQSSKESEVEEASSSTNVDPSVYELVIDNDSGTYRPKGDLLPQLKEFLSYNLPGLHIMTLDCSKDADLEEELKKRQRERKTEEMGEVVYKQTSRSGSISSSDESDLDDLAAAGHQNPNVIKTVKKDLSLRGSQNAAKFKKIAKGPGKEAIESEALKLGHANAA